MQDFYALPQADADAALKAVKKAFPSFEAWETANEDDGDHGGYCVWGVYSLDEETNHPRDFYVTFEALSDGWRGYLTIGQHAFMWSSADDGDAYLASTEPAASLDDAIDSLKAEIDSLFRGLLAS